MKASVRLTGLLSVVAVLGMWNLTAAADELPAGYVRLESITSDGRQYINTKYVHKANTRIECEVNVVAAQDMDTPYVAIFGARQGSPYAKSFVFFSHFGSPTANHPVYNRSGGEVAGEGFFFDERIHLTCAGDQAEWYKMDDFSARGSTTASGTCDDGGNPMLIFDLNANGGEGVTSDNRRIKMTLYSFAIYEGEELVHDFVPCRDESGAVGLYDIKAGGFFGNQGEGEFIPSRPAARLNYVSLGGTREEWVDTGYTHKTNTKVVCEVDIDSSHTPTYAAVFGARMFNCGNNAYVFFSRYANTYTSYSRTGREDVDATSIVYDQRVNITTLGDTASWYPVATPTDVHTYKTFGTCDDGVNTMFIFNLNTAGKGGKTPESICANKMKLYSFKVTEEGETGSVPQLDLVPWRMANGQPCLRDKSTGRICRPNKGSFAYGIAYAETGSSERISIYDGTLTAADIAGFATCEKIGDDVLNAGAVTAFPAALTLTSGKLAFTDGEAKAVTVAGTLSLAGGTKLALDVNADGCDVLTANAISISQASESNPIVLELTASGVTALDGEIALLCGSGLTASDAAKFSLKCDLPVDLKAEEGRLLLVGRTVGAVAWSGEAGEDRRWSVPLNWEGGEAPVTGDSIRFDMDTGAVTVETTDDIADLVVSELTFGLGSFVINGDQTLGVKGAIRQAAGTQVINAKTELGETGGGFTIDNTGSLSLLGSVAMKAASFAKTGAGELCADGKILGVSEAAISNGTLKVSSTSAQALSSSEIGGKLTIAEGARLDFNYGAGVPQNDATRSSFTGGKEVHVAGSGPDGLGALYNSAQGGDAGSLLSQVVLEGDTTVGGASRIDLWNAARLYGARPYVYGPDYTFTSYVTAQHGFNFNEADVTLAKLVAAPGGRIGMVGTINLNISEDIELQNGSQLDLWSANLTGTGTVRVPSGATATVNKLAGTSYFSTPVSVETDAKLVENGGGDVIFNSKLTGSGEIVNNEGAVRFCEGMDGSEFTGSFSSPGHGWLWFGDGIGGLPSRLIGNVGIMNPDQVLFYIGKSGVVDSHVYDAYVANRYVGIYSRNLWATNELRNATWNLANLLIGSANDYGVWKIGDGATVNVSGFFYTANEGATKDVYVEIAQGGSLNLGGGDLCPGRFGEGSDAYHLFTLNGGTFTSPYKSLIVGYGIRHIYFTLNDGLFSVKGIDFRNYNGGLNPAHDECITQHGGVFEIGDEGFHIEFTKVALPYLNLAGGTLRPTADFTNRHGARMVATFGFLADRPGAETYTIDLNGKTVNWNTGLLGQSNVEIVGDGTFTTPGGVQGVTGGRWSVAANSTADVDLSGAAGFGGGIGLGTNATAKIKIAGEGLAEFDVFRKALDITGIASVKSCDKPYHFTVNTFDEMHLASGYPALGDNFYMSYRGQFYVPEELAGTWYFASCFDDIMDFSIDGGDSLIYYENSWGRTDRASCNLTAGWHDFLIVCGQTGGGWGPDIPGWAGVMALGWTTDAAAAESTDASLYAKFDPSTLKMRCRPAADIKGLVRWQHDTRNCDLGGTLDDWMEPTTTYNNIDCQIASIKNLLCTANTCSYVDSRRNRLSGYVYIPTTGTWSVAGQFDDKFCLRMDGEIVVSYDSFDRAFSNDAVELTQGWHFFDIQFADTNGGFGASYTDSTGALCAVAFRAPGAEAYLAFNEDNFAFSLDPSERKAGLGGVTTLESGSALVNTAAGDCPIHGVLEGTGKLRGGFAFTEDGTWRVTADAKRITEIADISEVTGDAFISNLGNIEVVFTERPVRKRFCLCDAGSLTADAAAKIAVSVRLAEGATGALATDGWTAEIVGDKLYVVNPDTPGTLIIVR